jgi:S-adenosylmethionine decarboxylase proenzyme
LETISHHFLLELNGVNSKILDNLEYIQEGMVSCVRESGATYINDNFHKFSPQGVSGIILIAESHVSIHTWPESEYAALDVFTCGDFKIGQNITRNLIDLFSPTKYTNQYIKRGI